MRDPILAGVVTENTDPDLGQSFYSDAKSFLGLNEEQVNAISEFIREIDLTQVGNGHDVADHTFHVYRSIQGSLFAFGSRSENFSWKEQVSTIRILFEYWNNFDGFRRKLWAVMRKTEQQFDGIEEVDRERINHLCKSLLKYYAYFCSVLHQKPGGISRNWQKITGSVEEIPYEAAYRDENFITVLRLLFEELLELEELVRKHATN